MRLEYGSGLTSAPPVPLSGRAVVPSRRSLCAALLVGVLAFAPVAAAVHDLVAAHRYCPVHGVFEETQATSAQPAPWLLAREAPPADRGDHHECTFAAAARARALPPLRVLPAEAVAPAPRAPAPRADVRPPIPLLANAPKLAPPHRGS
jgi:hypothetical protein